MFAWTKTGLSPISYAFVFVRCPSKTMMFVRYALLCLSLVATSHAQVPAPLLKQALLDLYQSTGGDHWKVKTNWNTDQDICTWFGIKCLVHAHNVTTEINLPNNNLRGSLPASIGTFSDLKKLDLQGNLISGPIPSTISKLYVLRFLYLNGNALTGPLPAQIYNQERNVTFPVGTFLRELNLANNQLSGEIPDTWFGPSQKPEFPPPVNLQVINLQYNKFSGDIPVSISNAHDLTTLLLDYNDMDGTLNNTVLNSWLGTRKYCNLEGNQWKGTVPNNVKAACFP